MDWNYISARTYQENFSIKRLSVNPSVHLDWLLKIYQISELKWTELSYRLTMYELKHMYENDSLTS